MPDFNHICTIPKEFWLWLRESQILSQTSWAGVPDRQQCPSQNKQSFCTEVQALSPCRRWTPVLNANTPLCWQRVCSVTRARIFWGWIIGSSDLCLRNWRAAAITEAPAHYKGTFVWQVVFTWKIIFQHSRRLNLLPANSARTPFSLWLYRHFHDFFAAPLKKSAFMEGGNLWTSTPDRFYQPVPGVAFAFSWNSELLLNRKHYQLFQREMNTQAGNFSFSIPGYCIQT